MANKKRLLKTADLRNELDALRKRGVILPSNPQAAMRTAAEMSKMISTPGSLQKDLDAASLPDPKNHRVTDSPSPYNMRSLTMGNSPAQHNNNMRQIHEMRMARGRGSGMQHTSMASDVTAAIPRFYDPMEYWDLSGLPFNMQDEGHRHKLHKWMRLYYAVHPIIPTLVDIFTRFPLSGLELYCLGGETKVITRRGRLPIKELAGTQQYVLDGRGQWVEAEFSSYGEQQLYEIVMRHNKRDQVIRATDNHRWILKDGSEVLTKDLQPGQRLKKVVGQNRVSRTTLSPIGIQHGFTFGDGSLKTNSGGGAYVNMHGEKDAAMLHWFERHNRFTYTSGGTGTIAPFVQVTGLPRFFKSLPSLDESVEYLYGFVAGYFAADGTVSKKGEIVLYSTHRANIEHVQAICDRLGIETALPYEVTVPDDRPFKSSTGVMFFLPIKAHSLNEDFFLIDEHRARFNDHMEAKAARTSGSGVYDRNHWTVVSVCRQEGTEETFCATVPTTHSFVLDGNVLTGNSKDKKLTQFYEDLFLDNHRLNYEDFLVALGREYWLVGEVFPLGSFNETLGVWDREELLNPEDIVIERVPMMGATYLKIKPPEHMIRLVKTHSPPKEYKLLMDSMPELVPYLLRGEPFPVSDVLLKHISFKLTDFDDHGTPILLRALRTLMHEEKLLASQDAIAERLYSPLILAKLGVQDLGGDQGPWIPGPDALEALRDDMDIALSSDFRLLVHHFGLDISNVFGREQMPDLGNDFDRIERRLMQVFGVNPALLSGGDNSQPYASSALQAEFMSQMLSTYQRFLKEHYRQRALVVAEAQEHWEYDKRGETRVPVMEEVIEFDEEGNAFIEQRHKLMIPEMEMASLDLRDEATERQYLMALRQLGLPISDENLMVNVGFEWEDSLDELSEEAIKKTVAQQMAKLQAYKIMLQSGLPIPPDLKAEVESIQAPGQPGGSQPGLPPGGAVPPGGPGGPGGGDPGAGAPPGGGEYVMPPVPQDVSNALGGGPPTYTPGGPAGGPGGAPDISSERKQGMPAMSSVQAVASAILSLDEQIAKHKELLIQLEVAKRDRKSKTSKRTVVSAEEAAEKVEWDLHAARRVIRQKLAKKHVNIPFVDPSFEDDPDR